MLGIAMTACNQNTPNSAQSEKLRKRALRNQAKLGLAFLFQAVGSSDVQNREGSLAAFENLINENANVSHAYEYGWLTTKEELRSSWLSPGPIDESLAFKNFDLLKGLCPQCGIWNSGMILMAVGNLDDDPGLDVWTMDQTRIFVHLLED